MRTRRTGPRRAAAAIALAPVAALLVGCGGPDGEPMHVTITSSSSSTFLVDATEGESVVLDDGIGDDVEVTIESVDDDEVELSTSTDLSPVNEGGGISLHPEDLVSDFTVTKGDELRFATPTTDAGTMWTATLEDGPA